MVGRNSEIAREDVHRPSRNDPQNGVRVDDSIHDFIDEAVSAEGDHKFIAVFDSTTRHRDRFVARGRLGAIELEAGFEGGDDDPLERGRYPSGLGVHDQMRAQHNGQYPSIEGYDARMIHEYGDVIAVDTFMHGFEGITAVYVLPPDVLIEVGPATSLESTLAGLEEAGVKNLEWIIVTHIHLDHAGAIGHFAERFRNARIAVRVEGAPHLVDPTRLWASASRLYRDMEGMWGEMKPVAEERILAVDTDGLIGELSDGRRIEAIHAPGHARHQMALLERRSGDMFVGDAIGVRIQDAGVIRPATPPPDFDLEVAVETIERLRSLRPARIFPTHFGPAPNADDAFTEGGSRMHQWVEAAEKVIADGGGVEEIAEEFRRKKSEFYPDLSDDLVKRLEGTTSYDLNAAGIFRYLTKRRETS